MFHYFYRIESFQKTDAQKKSIQIAEKLILPFFAHHRFRLLIVPVIFGQLGNLYREEGQLHKAVFAYQKARNLWAEITDKDDRCIKKWEDKAEQVIEEISHRDKPWLRLVKL